MIAALGVDKLDVHPDAIGRALDADRLGRRGRAAGREQVSRPKFCISKISKCLIRLDKSVFGWIRTDYSFRKLTPSKSRVRSR